jgi:hypothetical protein
MSDDYDDRDTLLWGGRAIGAAIGKSQKATLHMLERGQIKSAVKRCSQWTAWRNALRREFGLGRLADDADNAVTVQVNGGA